MSAACGVPFTITLDGVARVTVTRNSDGLVVKEHDVLTSFTAMFESPLTLGGTGLSFTNRSPGVVTFDYGDGAAVGSTAVITGDITQIDLPTGRTSGLVEAMKVVGNIEGIEFIRFDDKDVVRHQLVQQIVKAYESYGGSRQ